MSLTNAELNLAQADTALATTSRQVDTALIAYQSGEELTKKALSHIEELRKLLPQIVTLHEEAGAAIAAAVEPAKSAEEHLRTVDPDGVSSVGRNALPATNIASGIVEHQAESAADGAEVPEHAAKLLRSLSVAMSSVKLLFETPVREDRLPRAKVKLHEARDTIQTARGTGNQ